MLAEVVEAVLVRVLRTYRAELQAKLEQREKDHHREDPSHWERVFVAGVRREPMAAQFPYREGRVSRRAAELAVLRSYHPA